MHHTLSYREWPASIAATPLVAAEPTFSIGEIAREFGVTFRALRFYESRGLLSPRRMGQKRRYRQSDRERLAVILRGKTLGFTLDQISRMIRGGAAGSLDLTRHRCAEQINLLERRKRQIENALAELRLAYAAPESEPRNVSWQLEA
jgi:DNA-binding transcriptional MerR regulator